MEKKKVETVATSCLLAETEGEVKPFVEADQVCVAVREQTNKPAEVEFCFFQILTPAQRRVVVGSFVVSAFQARHMRNAISKVLLVVGGEKKGEEVLVDPNAERLETARKEAARFVS